MATKGLNGWPRFPQQDLPSSGGHPRDEDNHLSPLVSDLGEGIVGWIGIVDSGLEVSDFAQMQCFSKVKRVYICIQRNLKRIK